VAELVRLEVIERSLALASTSGSCRDQALLKAAVPAAV
jgi:hypothetical protein